MNRKLLSTALVVGAVGAGALMAACDEKSSQPPGSMSMQPPGPSSSARAQSLARMPEFLKSANEAVESNDADTEETSVTQSSARPSVDDGNPDNTIAIFDEAESSVSPGIYQLDVYCSGTGSLTVKFAIDETAKEAKLEKCGGTAAAQVGISLAVAEQSDSAIEVVDITPSTDSVSAISYEIRRPKRAPRIRTLIG